MLNEMNYIDLFVPFLLCVQPLGNPEIDITITKTFNLRVPQLINTFCDEGLNEITSKQ